MPFISALPLLLGFSVFCLKGCRRMCEELSACCVVCKLSLCPWAGPVRLPVSGRKKGDVVISVIVVRLIMRRPLPGLEEDGSFIREC